MLLSEELYIWRNVFYVGIPMKEAVPMNSLINVCQKVQKFLSKIFS